MFSLPLSLGITQDNKENFSNGTSGMALVYDDKDKVSYCAIPKVASSTWCWHFIKLSKEYEEIKMDLTLTEGNLTEADVSRRKQVLQTFAPRVWPVPHSGEELAAAWQQTVSLVIVRHPLSR